MPVKNIIPGQTVTKEKLQRARELRRNTTPAEKVLRNELRANKLGFHFRRHTCLGGRCQGQVIAGFIVDFYCHKAALVTEVDGHIHDLPPPSFGHLPQIPRTWNLGEDGWRRGEYPMNVRFINNSTCWLSPAFGEGHTCYIEILSRTRPANWKRFSGQVARDWLTLTTYS